MLIEHCGEAVVFRPPPVEQLTEGERRQLSATLEGVVDSWRGATAIGMRVGELRQYSETVRAAEDEVWFHVERVPLALGLTPNAAASLLCVNLGSPMPEDPASVLSEVDFALLDAWAARALPALVSALKGEPGGDVRRRHEGPRPEGDRVTAELTFADSLFAGHIIIGGGIARKGRERAGKTLAQHPELLLHARITVHARITSEPVPMPELLSLECGDVLLLGKKTVIEAELSAGDSVVAAGRPGARDGQRALRIKGAVLDDREDRLGATSDGF